MGRLYWIAAAVLAAIAAHSAFILAAPALSFSRDVTTLSSAAGPNRFFILDAAQQAKLFPAYPATSVIGLCAFDVSDGIVTLTATMPDGYWTLNVYSRRGNVIYAVNDSQAGTNTFTLELSLEPGILDMLLQATQKERPDIDIGWTVESPDSTGLAVLLYPVSEPGARAAAIRRMESSACSARAAS